jgi:hypothetical protein
LPCTSKRRLNVNYVGSDSYAVRRHVELNHKKVNFDETIITREQVEVDDKNCFVKETIINHSKIHKVLQSSQPHNLETVPASEKTDNRETERASVTEPASKKVKILQSSHLHNRETVPTSDTTDNCKTASEAVKVLQSLQPHNSQR